MKAVEAITAELFFIKDRLLIFLCGFDLPVSMVSPK
jgi:hypothetical protein